MKDVWDSGDIPLVARTAADRLEVLAPFGGNYLDDEKLDLVDELRALAEDEGATTSDFDNVWGRVYDWADTPLDSSFGGKKVCWVATF
jgi:hypothetical protein